jgi:NAD(P)-dependent dehydrogenase (short-subunit alcohol dehydrogenase family)
MTKAMQSNKDFMARVNPRIAAGRVGTPGDFAGIAGFLASSASDYVTGADIRVDGGLMWGHEPPCYRR